MGDGRRCRKRNGRLTFVRSGGRRQICALAAGSSGLGVAPAGTQLSAVLVCRTMGR